MVQKILITGARAPIALELARSFAAHGEVVIMADSLHLTIARWSNKVTKYYVLPSPRYNITDFVSEIQEIIKNEGITHLIPTCEEAIYIACHKEKFDCKVWTCDKELMINLHNKYRFYKQFNQQLPMPETILVKHFLNWQTSDEYVFKPIYSRFATAVLTKKMLSNDHFSEKEREKWLAQKFIKGREICVYSLWDNGVLKAYSTYLPLYRAGKGAGIFFEPFTNNEVLELVKNFGQQINYTGQLCFDVILDGENKPYFIECNPRGTSGLHLINRDFARCVLENETVIVTQKDDFAIKCVMAIFHPLALLNRKVCNAKDVIYRSDDVKPFVLQVLSLFEILFIKFTKGRTLQEATTSDIEWNGEV